MGCAILGDSETGEAVFYCNTSDWAFGPLMDDREQAERFIEYLSEDPRRYSTEALRTQWVTFVKTERAEKEKPKIASESLETI